MSKNCSTNGEILHSIRMVAKLTGLKPHVIRVWERRYKIVRPARTTTNRRLYSPAEVERLKLLRQAIESGYRIGDIADLNQTQLLALIAPDSKNSAAEPQALLAAAAPSEFVKRGYAAIQAMDPQALETVLYSAAVELEQMRLLSEVIVPLVQRVGQSWELGELKVAHEHVASTVMRTFLGQACRTWSPHPGAPSILVTTPAGQLHELGAALAAAVAGQVGWRVVYAGAGMPAAEIAAVAIQNRVRAVALSIIYPADDPELGTELLWLRKLLPLETTILIGGQAAIGYQQPIKTMGAITVDSLDAFRQEITRLRANG